MMICKKCSFNNEDGAVFCAECGTDLKSADSVTIARPSETQQTTLGGNELEMPKNTKHNYYASQPATPPVTYSAPAAPTPTPTYAPPVTPVYTAPAAPTYVTPVYVAPVAPVYAAPTGVFDEKGMRTVAATKKLAASPLMIVAAIALTLSTICSFVSYFANFDIWKSFFATLISSFAELVEGYNYETLETIYSIAPLFAIIGGLIVLTTTTLMEVGIWTTVAQGFSRTPVFNTSGLSAIKSAQRMYITIASCGIGYYVIMRILFIAKYSQRGYEITGEMLSPLLIEMFVIVACVVIYILAYANANGSISRCNNSMKYNGSVYYASPFVAIVMFGIALLSLICIIAPYGAFSSGVPGMSFFSLLIRLFNIDVFSRIGTICFAASSICFGVMIFMQRSLMIRVNYENRYL